MLFHPYLRLPGRGRFILREAKHGQISVGFQNGILNRFDLQHILLPQMAHQLIQRHPGAAQIFLENLPLPDQNHRLAAKQPPDKNTAHDNPGKHQLQAKHRQYGHDPRKQRNSSILHGNGCQIGHQHGHYEFRGFHLTDLPLTHKPDTKDQQ